MRAILKFDNKRVSKPLITKVAIEKNVPLNILRADINEKGGKVLIEIPDAHTQEILEAITKEGVEIEQKTLISLEDNCISCGHCITLCPVDAISINSDLTVNVKEEKCIQCGRCVDACPVRAIILLP